MKVKSKHNGKIYTVYDICNFEAPDVQFLIYNYYYENSWLYVSAKYFEPVEE